MRVTASAVVWGLFTISACAPTTDAASDGPRLGVWRADSAATVLHEWNAGLPNATRLVVGDTAVWRALWQQLYRGRYPLPALDPVDFSTGSVLVAGMGARGSSGYDIRIDSVVEFASGSVAYVTEVSPSGEADCGYLGVETLPVHAVLVPRVGGIQRWETQALARGCH